MRCPYCSSTASKVVDKRDNSDDFSTRRRRQCLRCGRRFTTYERIEKVEVVVIKKDGSFENFDCEKLRKGIKKAIDMEKISEREIDEFCDTVTRKVMTSSNPVTTVEIGNMVLDWLKTLDPLAYMRFASVYKDFKSVKDLKNEIDTLI
ncbi:transcriptional repressor NrdR [Candidatus Dojkabacteria bacterium]|mgnify:FL=1|jgi:transcriptional repressor NrdR|uniref:Transcriptional repressor NrdR n=1 Tax=Candidatus Dojkabacteria bacterium TaxID=2099670 RepID=A0A847ETK3_9BACT|nr:transcriptional repressor NrdR [Candidatus Dojkabacteria bacterium]HRX44118.1 transcriptional regulator NrdR [Candidatus Dojkabacteria bacterium]